MNRRESFKLILGTVGVFILSSNGVVQANPVSKEALDKWKSLSPQEKEKLRERYRKFKALSPEAREKLIVNSKRFKNLNPDQKQRVLANFKRFENMTPEQRQRMRERHQKWKLLTPQQRQNIREKIRDRRESKQERFENRPDLNGSRPGKGHLGGRR